MNEKKQTTFLEEIRALAPKHTMTTANLPKKKTSSTWQLFVDGASRGNPGPSGAGAYINLGNGQTIKGHWYLGKKTNNQAEYLALALAILTVKEELTKCDLPHPSITITSDSELLIKQMQGIYKIKNPALALLHRLITRELAGISHSFKHVLRAQNTNADTLANMGIDKKRKVPASFEQILADYDIAL
jgi:ribonuclease HI